MLHVVVGTIGEPFLLPAGGIEAYQVACNVLQLFLRAFLYSLPLSSA